MNGTLKGWRVDTKYHKIEKPIITSNYMDKLLELQPDSNAPFNKLGRGNTGYLFAANKELADFIISKTIEKQSTNADKYKLARLLRITTDN